MTSTIFSVVMDVVLRKYGGVMETRTALMDQMKAHAVSSVSIVFGTIKEMFWFSILYFLVQCHYTSSTFWDICNKTRKMLCGCIPQEGV